MDRLLVLQEGVHTRSLFGPGVFESSFRCKPVRKRARSIPARSTPARSRPCGMPGVLSAARTAPGAACRRDRSKRARRPVRRRARRPVHSMQVRNRSSRGRRTGRRTDRNAAWRKDRSTRAHRPARTRVRMPVRKRAHRPARSNSSHGRRTGPRKGRNAASHRGRTPARTPVRNRPVRNRPVRNRPAHQTGTDRLGYWRRSSPTRQPWRSPARGNDVSWEVLLVRKKPNWILAQFSAGKDSGSNLPVAIDGKRNRS